jgi:hypothetical protein
MDLRIRVATVVGLALLGQIRAEAGMDVTVPWIVGGTGVERGVVQIRCSTDAPTVVRLSRGAVLQVNGDTKRDLVFATAHGLPESPGDVLGICRVLGAHGRPYRIANVWRSARTGLGIADDWAVLLVEGRLEGDVGRLAPAKVSGDEWTQLADGAATVRVLLRQADPREGDCHLRQLTVPYEYLPTELLVYFCGATTRAAGLSGSPLLIGVEGRPFVVGVHLGWGLQMLDDGRLHAVSLGRPIDGEIAAAIAEAAEEARR